MEVVYKGQLGGKEEIIRFLQDLYSIEESYFVKVTIVGFCVTLTDSKNMFLDDLFGIDGKMSRRHWGMKIKKTIKEVAE